MSFSLTNHIILLSVTGVALVFCSPVAAHDVPPGEQAMHQKPVIDGVIHPEEYAGSSAFQDGIFTVYWHDFGDILYLGITGKTSGWIAIGIDPEQMMLGADMIFGWVDSSGTTCMDMYSTGGTGPHPPDVDLGGTSDIIAYAGTEVNDVTTLEFSRPLVSADQYDKNIQTDMETHIIWAIGGADSMDARHTDRGSGVINIGAEETSDFRSTVNHPGGSLWKFHASISGLSLIFLATGITLSRMRKKVKAWLIKHRRLELSAVGVVILTVIFAAIMVRIMGFPHFKTVHSWFGLASVLLAANSAYLGVWSTKAGSKGGEIRIIHKWNGWIAGIIMITTIILGLKMKGII
jgi:hypothetical protein